MSGLAGAPAGNGGVGDDGRRYIAYAIFVGLAVLLCLIVFVAITTVTVRTKNSSKPKRTRNPR